LGNSNTSETKDKVRTPTVMRLSTQPSRVKVAVASEGYATGGEFFSARGTCANLTLDVSSNIKKKYTIVRLLARVPFKRPLGTPLTTGGLGERCC
jgi:hypothetical protein